MAVAVVGGRDALESSALSYEGNWGRSDTPEQRSAEFWFYQLSY